ncbi:unnamed protein product [Soboliphyme baturini]|uniref:Uncharacterized protein n=1 Tax=Soboliphyme baturini TaxID=241478 RepID=A0A183ILJ0_9BILA|nr:unnamed protein product [Soboliphyme baturini]
MHAHKQNITAGRVQKTFYVITRKVAKMQIDADRLPFCLSLDNAVKTARKFDFNEIFEQTRQSAISRYRGTVEGIHEDKASTSNKSGYVADASRMLNASYSELDEDDEEGEDDLVGPAVPDALKPCRSSADADADYDSGVDDEYNTGGESHEMVC